MPIINFEDIKSELKLIWTNSMEHFWYEKVWSILEHHNLTSYKNTEGYHIVYIRALTLSMLYSEFCDICFDETTYYSCCDYKFEDELNDIVLGQLYGKLNTLEVSTDRNYILCCLADSQRDIVISTLRKELSDVEILAGMYYASYDGFNFSKDEEDTEIHTITNVYDFWKHIINNIECSLNNFNSGNISSAYDWLSQGAYKIRNFYNSSDN